VRAWGHPRDDRPAPAFTTTVGREQAARARDLAAANRRAFLGVPEPLEHVPSYEELAGWRAERARLRAERRELEARRRTQRIVAGIIGLTASPFVAAIVHAATS
jgi:hypothetical protein